jgi:quinol monooxygenase YgiN
MKEDTVCTLVPYFKVHAGKLDAFRAGMAAFVEKTRNEPGCEHYAFSVSGDSVHCREGYADAGALLAHLDNVGALLQQALKIADIARLEVHGPAAEIAKLREPMAGLKPQFYELVPGGLRR